MSDRAPGNETVWISRGGVRIAPFRRQNARRGSSSELVLRFRFGGKMKIYREIDFYLGARRLKNLCRICYLMTWLRILTRIDLVKSESFKINLVCLNLIKCGHILSTISVAVENAECVNFIITTRMQLTANTNPFYRCAQFQNFGE